MKITSFWDSTQCSVVDNYTDVLEGPTSLILLSVRSRNGRLNAAGFSETLVPFNQITFYYMPGVRNLKLVTRLNCINGIRIKDTGDMYINSENFKM
jgi:hypothetical protein